MNRPGLWNLPVAAYSFLVGGALLLGADYPIAIQYAAADDVWVRICGMLMLVFAYFHFEMYRSPQRSILAGSSVVQSLFLIVALFQAIRHQSRILSVLSFLIAVVLIGYVLSFRSYRGDVSKSLPMPKTTFWNLYVAGYTFLFGVLLAFLQDTPILTWMGFPAPEGIWVRVAGLCFFGLSIINSIVFFEKGTLETIRAILNFRVGIVITLILLAIIGYPPFLLVVASIVSVGIIGTVINYRIEGKRESVGSSGEGVVRGNHA